ncbi:amidase [Alcaligenaceae bacterium CGII-47]|nr:amidase [Alcaligenaceae bacterium CGII-47]
MTSTESNFADVSALSLANRIATQNLRAADLTQACVDHIRQHNQQLLAFVEIYEEDAILGAQASDMSIRSGHRTGPLQGMPIGLKDLIHIEGHVTTAGSLAWRGQRATHTATIVHKLVQAGMIILGKTHAVEFALGGWGTNETVGTPWNPWDLSTHRVPGGSSSGSAVAVAAGLVPWALGTDTGGSIRMPSGYCGLTGLKPTVGRISTYGVVPLSRTMDVIGPITHTVEDAAWLYAILQGRDHRDRHTWAMIEDDPRPHLKRGVKGLKLARMPEIEREGVDDQVLEAYDAALDALAACGATIETITLPRRFHDYMADNARIVSAEAYAEFHVLAHDLTAPLDPVVRARMLTGASTTAADYLQTLQTREADIAEFNRAMAPFDALLTPTTASTAIPVSEIDPNNQPSRFTRIANYLNLCALSVPNGLDDRGLPTSLQITCKYADERTALRIGWAYQQASNWHLRRPQGF